MTNLQLSITITAEASEAMNRLSPTHRGRVLMFLHTTADRWEGRHVHVLRDYSMGDADHPAFLFLVFIAPDDADTGSPPLFAVGCYYSAADEVYRTAS